MTEERAIVGLKKTTAFLCWVLAIIVGGWCLSWFEPDWPAINDYLNVKIPAAMVGIFFMFAATAVFNAVTLGRNYGHLKDDPMASAIFFGSLLIALSFVISWA